MPKLKAHLQLHIGFDLMLYHFLIAETFRLQKVTLSCLVTFWMKTGMKEFLMGKLELSLLTLLRYAYGKINSILFFRGI